MKQYKKKIIILSILLVVVTIILFLIKAVDKTYGVKNEKKLNVLTEKPRLEDNYYNNVNYDTLSKLNFSEEKLMDSYSLVGETTKEISREKVEIVKSILNNCSKYDSKKNSDYYNICKLYNREKNYKYDENKKIVDDFINRIKNSKSIEEYINAITYINSNSSSNILLSIDYGLYVNKQFSDYKYGELKQNLFRTGEVLNLLEPVMYDCNNIDSYYNQNTMSNYDSSTSKYKQYDIAILKEYGYSENDAKDIVKRVYSLFLKLARFSSFDSDKLYYNKSYSLLELNKKYNNINFNKVFNSKDNNKKVIIANEAQLKTINSLLTTENLDALKEYAIIRVLDSLGGYTSEKYDKLREEINVALSEDEEDDSYYEYAIIFKMFDDVITDEFIKKHISKEEINLYYNLALNYLKTYKKVISEEEWLSEKTKKIAINKINNMQVVVGNTDHSERRYKKLDLNYSNNDILFFKKLFKSYNKNIFQYLKNGKLSEYNNEMDRLVINAFYMPIENKFVILPGYIYYADKTFGINKDNINSKKPEVLGGTGTVIGHEIGHAFDDEGSKYDEYGNEINWWNETDKLNYNKLTAKVEEAYRKNNQKGLETLGENIADLAGMHVTMELAKEYNLSNEEYKRFFETYAKSYLSQDTYLAELYNLLSDPHSPNINRVNVVLSNTDKFYEIYNIKETDKMYIEKKNRVSVW